MSLDKVDFPAVTICRTTPFQRGHLQSAMLVPDDEPNPGDWVGVLYRGSDPALGYVASNDPGGRTLNERFKNEYFATVLTKDLPKMSPEDWEHVARRIRQIGNTLTAVQTSLLTMFPVRNIVQSCSFPAVVQGAPGDIFLDCHPDAMPEIWDVVTVPDYGAAAGPPNRRRR